MSSLESASSRFTAADAVAGILAALSLALSLVALVQYPARLVPVAALLALASGRMSTRFSSLATAAMLVACAAWIVGLTLAVITDNPLL